MAREPLRATTSSPPINARHGRVRSRCARDDAKQLARLSGAPRMLVRPVDPWSVLENVAGGNPADAGGGRAPSVIGRGLAIMIGHDHGVSMPPSEA